MSTVNEIKATEPRPTEGQELTQRPLASTREDEQGAHLKVALPGVRKEDVKLSVHEQNLRIEAVRQDNIPPDWKPLSESGPRIRYQLTARLTQRLDGNAIAADFEDGVLSVSVPVREEAKPRDIAIH